jgi:hypothetical protein
MIQVCTTATSAMARSRGKISVAVYTTDNLSQFDEESRQVIGNDND